MSSRSTAALVLAISASLLGASCSSNPSVNSAAKKLNATTANEVLSYNDSVAPSTREFVSYGALPDTVQRAMTDYIKTGEWKTITYAYPQAFIRIPNPTTHQDEYWAICIDTRGNLIGILPKKDARKMKTVGNHQMIINKTPRSAGLSYAILKGLQPADEFRKSSRKGKGLDTAAPVAPPVNVVVPAAPKAPVAPAKPVAAPAAPAAAAAEQAPAASGEEDVFGGGTETETETTTTETATPAGETETTTTEEVTF